jgi:hypothetical protein
VIWWLPSAKRLGVGERLASIGMARARRRQGGGYQGASEAEGGAECDRSPSARVRV